MAALLPWWAWSLISNACIQATEYLNHTTPDGAGWSSVLWKTAPLIVLAQYGLWASFSNANTLFAAWLVFTLGNAVMRVAMVNTLLGGQVSSWPIVMVGIATMIAGSLLVKQGLA